MSRTQVLAPRVRRLKADAVDWPHRDLGFQRVIVVAVHVRQIVHGAELRIGHDKVLGKAVLPEHGADNASRNGRQPGIGGTTRVVQRVQRGCQRVIVSIGEVTPEGCVCAQVHSRGLLNAAERRTHGSESRTRDVHSPEHVFQHRQCGTGIVARSRRIKGFLQSVVKEVGLIDVDHGVPLLPGQGSDVTQVHGQTR